MSDYISELTQGRVTFEMLDNLFQLKKMYKGNGKYANFYYDQPFSKIRESISLEDCQLLVREKICTYANIKYQGKVMGIYSDYKNTFKQTCSKCGGDGMFDYFSAVGHARCLKCWGRGYLRTEKKPKNEWQAPK